MKKFIKKNLKIIIAFAAGSLITTIVVYAATANSSDVWYDKSTSSAYGATKNDVQGAITELYQKAYECNNKTCPTTTCPTCHQYYGKTKVTANYDYYACTSGGKECGVGVASQCTNNDTSQSSCVGNFKYGKWRRLSYYSDSYGAFYTYFYTKLPDSIKINQQYILAIKLYSNYISSSTSKVDYDFKIYNRSDYTNYINCVIRTVSRTSGGPGREYNPKANPSNLYMDNHGNNGRIYAEDYNVRLDTSDNYNNGSNINIYCGISNDGYMWMGFTTAHPVGSESGKYAWMTRGDEFYFDYDIWYK